VNLAGVCYQTVITSVNKVLTVSSFFYFFIAEKIFAAFTVFFFEFLDPNSNQVFGLTWPKFQANSAIFLV